jgi:class 3 adenylate cyclase
MQIASRGFRVKTMIAPAHIVEKSAGREDEIELMFAPERNYAVCISINWRNFEELAATLPALEIASVLETYYQLVERLLTECIHGGAYYCDTMVDEMFVIVFSPEALGDPLPLTDAVLFARRLLRERPAAIANLSQIDIGISSGETLIGILGPKGHRKTTGLGETPGRAARLKSLGELLRQERGHLDRLIIDAASQTMLTGQSGFIKLPLGAERKVRDLDDRYVYFWEHKPNAPQGRAA